MLEIHFIVIRGTMELRGDIITGNTLALEDINTAIDRDIDRDVRMSYIE
jgi:hypothetical protein